MTLIRMRISWMTISREAQREVERAARAMKTMPARMREMILLLRGDLRSPLLDLQTPIWVDAIPRRRMAQLGFMKLN
jgi:hypothetical protein